MPVCLSAVSTPIRASRRRKVVQQSWPVLYLSSWIKVCFQKRCGGFFLFGGLTMDNLEEVEGTLARFWERHASVSNDQPRCPRRTIPFYIHGDEGRGACKRPLLVLSFQPVLGWQKDASINKEDAMNSKKPLCFESLEFYKSYVVNYLAILYYILPVVEFFPFRQ